MLLDDLPKNKCDDLFCCLERGVVVRGMIVRGVIMRRLDYLRGRVRTMLIVRAGIQCRQQHGQHQRNMHAGQDSPRAATRFSRRCGADGVAELAEPFHMGVGDTRRAQHKQRHDPGMNAIAFHPVPCSLRTKSKKAVPSNGVPLYNSHHDPQRQPVIATRLPFQHRASCFDVGNCYAAMLPRSRR